MSRWLRWVFLCGAGRRCPQLQIADYAVFDEDGEPVEDFDPEGALVGAEWHCPTCGTCYRRTALLFRDGWIESDREMIV